MVDHSFLIVEIFLVVVLYSFPNLQTSHKNTVSLVCYQLQFLVSFLLILHIRIIYFFGFLNNWVNRGWYLHMFVWFLFLLSLVPVVPNSELVYFRGNFNRIQNDTFNFFLHQNLLGLAVDQINIDTLVVESMHFRLMHYHYFQNKIWDLPSLKIQRLTPCIFFLEQNISTQLRIGHNIGKDLLIMLFWVYWQLLFHGSLCGNLWRNEWR